MAVILSQILHPNLYKHLLFVGIHILINTSLCQMYNDYAEELLKLLELIFNIYMVMIWLFTCVHCLVHLAKDAK